MVMIRKQIYLEAAQDREIKAEAAARGLTEAEVIRERIDGGKRRPKVIRDAQLLKEELAALDRVIEQAPAGPGTGRKFNREELYDERIERQSPR